MALCYQPSLLVDLYEYNRANPSKDGGARCDVSPEKEHAVRIRHGRGIGIALRKAIPRVIFFDWRLRPR